MLHVLLYTLSRLCSKIPHNKLQHVLLELIHFVFKGGNQISIKSSAKGKIFGVKKVKDSIGFTCNSLKTAVKHLI